MNVAPPAADDVHLSLTRARSAASEEVRFRLKDIGCFFFSFHVLILGLIFSLASPRLTTAHVNSGYRLGLSECCAFRGMERAFRTRSLKRVFCKDVCNVAFSNIIIIVVLNI